jgi:hypothetical protein
MKNIFTLTIVLLTSAFLNAQSIDSTNNTYNNSASNLMLKDSKLVVGGYGEVHYNQPLDNSTYNNGLLDVHRVVMLFGYNFNRNTQFVTELEFEHVSEVYVEQAFLQHRINNYINLRAGLMLIPMGIINEYHEPTTFNGVERPHIDKYIAPSTWREIGLGATGNIFEASLKYQVYMFNGFNGYDGDAKFSGKNGLRKGRQKGIEAYVSSPNLSAKVEYYGIRGLNIGLSGYFGNTQSTLYHGISKDDSQAIAKADSSVVGMSMVGIDARYKSGAWQLRGQFYYNKLSNTEQYNYFTASADGSLNDLGSSMLGYYIEVGYDVLRNFDTMKQLVPFVRYEYYDTQNTMDGGDNVQSLRNLANENTVITTGLSLMLSKGSIAKMDMQFVKNAANDSFTQTINFGIGVMF